MQLSDRILVRTDHAEDNLTLQQLSRGREQVALCAAARIDSGSFGISGPVPLILDDVFVASDVARAEAAVKLLTDVAQQGHQILFLHLSERCA